ncbi:MAG: hypothetical protein LBL01_05450 [Bifidobacteriaceae bacterium]|jgi:hypothetical protein|nr:hypothetical protein [Bifidobacteriaceae bacterium]
MAPETRVPRPGKAAEYAIEFATREAEKGWRDLVATARNAAADAWDFLTKTPLLQGRDCYPLMGDLAVVRVGAKPYQRWQYKPTRGGRIWYAVATGDMTVWVERVSTGHPNETVKRHR